MPPPSLPTQQALTDLASLAARVCGVPWAWIRVGEGAGTPVFHAPGSGPERDPPFSETISAPDGEGKPMGSLTVADTEAREFSADRKLILSGLGRQAGALIALDRRAAEEGGARLQAAPDAGIGRNHAGGMVLDITDLEQARADTRLFDNVFRNLEVGVVVWKLDEQADEGSFRLIAMNSAAGRMTEISPQDILGRPLRDAFPDIFEKGYIRIFKRVLRTGRPMDLGEVRYGDARIKTSFFTAKVFPLPDGAVGIVFENVSEKRLFRDQLAQSVKRFELIARATNDALVELDPSTGEVWWNDRVFSLLGYDPDATGPSVEAWVERLHPEDRQRVVEEMKTITSGFEESFTQQYRIVRPDGTLAHIYSRGCLSRDQNGSIVRILAAMMDISGLKRAEQAMRENEERYRKLVELLPDVVAISIDGVLEFVNQAGLDFRGVDRMEDMVGRNVLDFIHPDDRLRIIERQKQLSIGAPVPPLPFKFLRQDGSHIESESRAVPFNFRGRKANLIVIRDVTERKLAEEALRRSEEHYRLLFHGNAQPMYLFDLETLRFLDVNLAAEAQYGYSREEFLSMTIRELRPPEDVRFVEEKVRVLRDNGGNMGVWRHRRKDGSLILAEVIAHALEQSGHPSAIALAHDVTEKLQAVEKLRHSEERYRTLARVSPVGLFRTDSTGWCNYVNEHCILITGLPFEGLEGRKWINGVHPEDRERVLSEWERTLAHGLPFHAEYRFRNAEGKVVWVLGRALPDKGPEGDLTGFVGTLTDITERKHAETLLAGQKRTLAMVASGWALADVLNGLLQYVEKEATGMTGGILLLEPDTRRLAWASSRGIPDGLRDALEKVQPTAEAGPPGLAAAERRMVICPEISGDDRWTHGRSQAVDHGLRSCAALPILGSYGGLLGSIVFFYRTPGEPAPFDIKLLETASDLAGIAVERWRQEEIGRLNQELSEENRRILEANRMKSEFMASMSHELRTPLNAIIGFSQLLIDRKVGTLNDKQSEYLGDILDGGMHLLRLINDVLDLAKIESGKMQLFPEPVSVPHAIREVCDILMPMALAKAIHFRIHADLEPEHAVLDSQKFKQVLYNLISNAIKFSKQGGLVLVGAERGEAGELRLKVTDHGIGIRKEDLSKLFQEFQQLDSGAARHFPGTGLGLVITKKLVELHRGTVGVESEAGKGSTFFAVFPELPAAEDG